MNQTFPDDSSAGTTLSPEIWSQDPLSQNLHGEARIKGTVATPEERIQVLVQTLKEDPNDPLGYYLIGIEYYKMARYDEAASAHRRAIELMEDYTAAYRDLGKALRDAGRREEAIAAFERGIAVAERTHDVQTMKEMQVFLRRLLE